MKKFILGLLVLGSVAISGCIYDIGYERYSNDTGGGYQQSSYGNGEWGVAFVGGYPDFCKEAAYYRAAELTWEKGCRYFKVLKKEDRSTNVRTSGPRVTAEGDHLGSSSVYVPVYYYKIKILHQKPDGKFVDAYHVLNTHNLPRKDAPYTVAERNKDKGTK